MLFSEEEAPLLKAWIVKRIENTSDADADVLAEYVLALLKHDGDLASVRKLCEQEIPDFLTEDSKAFLDDVFQALAYKSYLPGAAQPPPNGTIQPQAGGGSPFGPGTTATPQKGSRKRGFHDRGDFEDEEMAGQISGGRAFKQPRRGRGRGRMDNSRGGRSMDFGAMGLPPAPPGMAQFDPNRAMELMLQMQAMGIPVPGMSPQSGARGQPRRRGRCRDFDSKGFCSRGGTCPYDHGEEPIFFPVPLQGGMDDNPFGSEAPFPQADGFLVGNNDRGRRGRGGRKGRGNRKGGPRASFSAEGPVHDRSKSTIVVENIPEENFSEEEVKGFFSQFGNIVEVTMQAYKRLAIVKFDNWASANAAYHSPKVIFDNRFVKVFWYKDGADTLPPLGSANGSKLNGRGGSESADPASEIDMEEFTRKQEEAQKQYKEKEAKKLEVGQKLLELEKQQEELLAKHREESEKLRTKFAGRDSDAKDTDVDIELSGTDKLRAKLAALEQEAKILGIDPNAAGDEQAGSWPPPRGGYRGRGGAPRARGGHLARSRGSFRGQAGRHAAYAQYSIDNRPKKVAITGVDFTASEKDEALRHFLLNTGEFESVDTGPEVTHVSFQDRKTAEKFYFTLHGKELPGVDGRLELAWVNAPPAAKPPSTGKTSAANAGGTARVSGEDAVIQEGDEEEEEEEGQVMDDAPSREEEQRLVDMDYETVEAEIW